ncbi:LITAF-like zinc ribbon domain-domain-containing protein [Lobosporangium transversale]|uniref:LITAF-like zinc ribbon domain-domain-containing protein n=1 Tax=Lobosporangium transversale TaxID=64571 RepID=A0A1Y2G732_9FUNG|nr:LITAF-like zinc ribbon domain-domain-containing protein [Lobosporangium transversale]ORY99613.1 LITAF-like zinc ribbon domain-domain-containing protein [Lobosporangium transversale]|eukprot:XP_021875908.1 LITAF-like zinc ribbon domain-domain-containing protein [Lobosporangium transversale]
MSDKKGHYAPIPSEEEERNQLQDNSLLTQGFQPPPYTPSTAPSSPFIQPNNVPSAPGSSTVPNNLYPQLHSPVPQHPYQPTYPKLNDTSKPPPPMTPFYAPAPPHQHQGQQAHSMGSPLILMKSPGRIEDLKSQPGVVVCQHCHHLVLTETAPESGSCTYLGILGLLLAGVTSCGCCLLPLCITSMKDMMHSCPNCHEDIGLYSRLKEKTFPVRRG